MATINVKDAAGSTVALEKPLAAGQATMANSRPVVIASDQSALTVASHAVTNAGTFAVQATVAAAATNIAKAEDVASADADVGVPAMMVRKATPANTSGTDGDYEMLQGSAGRLWVDASGVTLTVGSHAVTNAGTFATQSAITAASGAIASGAVAAGAFASGSVADGAMVTLGAKADAKSTATDTTAVTLMQVAKQISASAQLISTALGSTALDLGAGTGGSRTLRVAIDTSQTDGSEYETVAASQTAQVLGATGASGDFVSGLLVVPATTSPGNVLLLDNATSITVFTGGASSVSNLVPFFIPLGMTSVSGAWKVTTGSNVSVIGIGNFT